MRRVSLAALVTVLLAVLVAPAAAQDAADVEGNVTRAEAVQAIDDAEAVIAEMQAENYSTRAVRDLLDRARLSLRRADYAHALRTNTSAEEEAEARDALAGLEWEEFTYADVLTSTDRIQQRRDTAFRLDDEITATRLGIEEARQDGVNVSDAETELDAARLAFQEERYDDAAEARDRAETALSEARSRRSALGVIAARSTDFLTANWRWILPGTVGILLVAGLGIHGYRLRKMRRRLQKLRARREAIDELMAETQAAYYREESIPQVVYETRMDRYREEEQDVDRTIPVVESAIERERLFSALKRVIPGVG